MAYENAADRMNMGGNPDRRKPPFLRLFRAVLLNLIMLACPVLAGIKVYVFYPSLARPLAIQDALAKKCPGLEITVFGRLTDLQAMVEREHPAAILAQMMTGKWKASRGWSSPWPSTRFSTCGRSVSWPSSTKPCWWK